MLGPYSLLVSALFYVSLMSLSYSVLILLILALFPLVSTSVSDLVTYSRIQREDLETSSTQFQPGDAHAPTKSFPALFLSTNLPQAWQTPKVFLTLTSTYSYPSTSPTLAPGCQELLLKVREAKIVSALSIPPSPPKLPPE